MTSRSAAPSAMHFNGAEPPRHLLFPPFPLQHKGWGWEEDTVMLSSGAIIEAVIPTEVKTVRTPHDVAASIIPLGCLMTEGDIPSHQRGITAWSHYCWWKCLLSVPLGEP